MPFSERVHLIGLDFGTTTSSAIVAAASIRRNSVNARMELSGLQELFRSELIFTPYQGEQLDLRQLETQIDAWLRQAGAQPGDLFGGGALLTGLAAQTANADGLITLLRHRLGEALIARADDPCLESWLAFMGNCAGLSRRHPEQTFLNVDIGGGTTNLALGRAGEVIATGCLFIGARHIQVEPGSYRIARMSIYAQELLHHLGIAKQVGDRLSDRDVERVVGRYLDLLEAVIRGEGEAGVSAWQSVGNRESLSRATLTLSGGVSELVYRHLSGEAWPSTTAFGDLGIDLAQRLAEGLFWAEHWRRHRPEAGGRATVFGLLRHSTHVSGSTIFLPFPEDLPLRDVPIVGTIGDDVHPAHLAEVIRLARGSPHGAAIRVILTRPGMESVKRLAQRLADVLEVQAYAMTRPLVLFVPHNVGKVLGHYITQWGAVPRHLIVIDEIDCHTAQYAHIGKLRDQIIPASFFGVR